MRPLRLSMTAFGPYAETEVVDFDALTELGLFVVAGNNGSGKTTIFDALHYALYGTLPGRRANYLRLKSDHADNKAECSVTLDFAAHHKHWRVTRSPKQQRPKRRGTGVTEAPAAATLFRLDDGTPTAITNRVDEVRAQCSELVGLSGKQFERVALLPQGQFSRVLSESGTDRRELLRTLFSSEIFGNATALLSEQAAEATAADRSVLERLDHQQAALANDLSALIDQPVASALPTLRGAISDYRRVHITKLADDVAVLEAAAKNAGRDHQSAIEVNQRIERRTQVQQELDRHRQGAEQHEHDLARLQRARSAVPVTSNARTLAGHEEHLRAARVRLDELHQQLNRALAHARATELDVLDQAHINAATSQLTELAQQLAHRSTAAIQVGDLELMTTEAHTELRRLSNDIRTLTEQHDVARSQLRQATTELNRLEGAADLEHCELALRTTSAQLAQRSELAELEAAHSAAVRRATELDAKLESLEFDRDQAHRAQTSQTTLQQKADKAFTDFETCTRRRDAALRYEAASTKLHQARHDLDQARVQADGLWHAFIAGTAARVAQALVDDEPCPVCGSAEHPEPAQPASDGKLVSEADVAAARLVVDNAQAAVRSTEVEIESLRATDADIASLSIVELAAEIATTKAMALGARAVADEARQHAAGYEQTTAELAHVAADRRTLEDELREIDGRRSRLHGALGDIANEPIATLRARVEQATADRTQAEGLAARTTELAALIAAAEHSVEALGLEQLAAQSRHASAQDQLAGRQADLDQATAALESIDADLASHTTTGADPSDAERRTQATRHGLELTTKATTEVALEHEAADAVRRATSVLNDRLAQSPFPSLESAMAAYIEPETIDQLEAHTAQYIGTDERLRGQLHELADTPDTMADLTEHSRLADEASQAFAGANRSLITVTTTLDRIANDLDTIETERESRQTADASTRRLERVAALVKGDNDRNTSLENWVLAAHLRDVVDLANIRLARSTHQRFQLCVLDDGENRRGKWGLDLGVEDTVTGTRRPTAGLSGGELFQASLALALGLADAVMSQTAGVRIDALFIDEGFGSLDEVSVERAIDLLDELRDRGAMVGVITHVPALLDALPLGVRVTEAASGHGSTIRQTGVPCAS